MNDIVKTNPACLEGKQTGVRQSVQGSKKPGDSTTASVDLNKADSLVDTSFKTPRKKRPSSRIPNTAKPSITANPSITNQKNSYVTSLPNKRKRGPNFKTDESTLAPSRNRQQHNHQDNKRPPSNQWRAYPPPRPRIRSFRDKRKRGPHFEPKSHTPNTSRANLKFEALQFFSFLRDSGRKPHNISPQTKEMIAKDFIRWVNFFNPIELSNCLNILRKMDTNYFTSELRNDAYLVRKAVLNSLHHANAQDVSLMLNAAIKLGLNGKESDLKTDLVTGSIIRTLPTATPQNASIMLNAAANLGFDKAAFKSSPDLVKNTLRKLLAKGNSQNVGLMLNAVLKMGFQASELGLDTAIVQTTFMRCFDCPNDNFKSQNVSLILSSIAKLGFTRFQLNIDANQIQEAITSSLSDAKPEGIVRMLGAAITLGFKAKELNLNSVLVARAIQNAFDAANVENLILMIDTSFKICQLKPDDSQALYINALSKLEHIIRSSKTKIKPQELGLMIQAYSNLDASSDLNRKIVDLIKESDQTEPEMDCFYQCFMGLFNQLNNASISNSIAELFKHADRLPLQKKNQLTKKVIDDAYLQYENSETAKDLKDKLNTLRKILSSFHPDAQDIMNEKLTPSMHKLLGLNSNKTLKNQPKPPNPLAQVKNSDESRRLVIRNKDSIESLGKIECKKVSELATYFVNGKIPKNKDDLVIMLPTRGKKPDLPAAQLIQATLESLPKNSSKQVRIILGVNDRIANQEKLLRRLEHIKQELKDLDFEDSQHRVIVHVEAYTWSVEKNPENRVTPFGEIRNFLFDTVIEHSKGAPFFLSMDADTSLTPEALERTFNLRDDEFTTAGHQVANHLDTGLTKNAFELHWLIQKSMYVVKGEEKVSLAYLAESCILCGPRSFKAACDLRNNNVSIFGKTDNEGGMYFARNLLSQEKRYLRTSKPCVNLHNINSFKVRDVSIESLSDLKKWLSAIAGQRQSTAGYDRYTRVLASSSLKIRPDALRPMTSILYVPNLLDTGLTLNQICKLSKNIKSRLNNKNDNSVTLSSLESTIVDKIQTSYFKIKEILGEPIAVEVTKNILRWMDITAKFCVKECEAIGKRYLTDQALPIQTLTSTPENPLIRPSLYNRGNLMPRLPYPKTSRVLEVKPKHPDAKRGGSSLQTKARTERERALPRIHIKTPPVRKSKLRIKISLNRRSEEVRALPLNPSLNDSSHKAHPSKTRKNVVNFSPNTNSDKGTHTNKKKGPSSNFKSKCELFVRCHSLEDAKKVLKEKFPIPIDKTVFRNSLFLQVETSLPQVLLELKKNWPGKDDEYLTHLIQETISNTEFKVDDFSRILPQAKSFESGITYRKLFKKALLTGARYCRKSPYYNFIDKKNHTRGIMPTGCIVSLKFFGFFDSYIDKLKKSSDLSKWEKEIIQQYSTGDFSPKVKRRILIQSLKNKEDFNRYLSQYSGSQKQKKAHYHSVLETVRTYLNSGHKNLISLVSEEMKQLS